MNIKEEEEGLEKPNRLYNLSRGDKFKVLCCEEEDSEEVYELHHLDGMYSFCSDSKGEVVHWAAMTPIMEV